MTRECPISIGISSFRHVAAAMAIWSLCFCGWAYLPPGSTAPGFDLPRADQDGRISLDSIKGLRLLILVRSDQKYTSDVVRLVQHLTRAKDHHSGDWTAILVWIGSEKPPALPAAQPLGRKDWIILSDVHSTTAQSYNVIVSPTIYLIDTGGKILEAFTAWSPQLESNVTQSIQKALGRPATATEEPKSLDGYSQAERAEMCFRAARNLEAQKSWESALAFYERGLTYEPANAAALAGAAQAALHMGQADKARQHAKRALAIDADHTLAKKIIAELDAGDPAPDMDKTP